MDKTTIGTHLGSEELRDLARKIKSFSRMVPAGRAARDWVHGYLAGKQEAMDILTERARSIELAERAESFGDWSIPDGWTVSWTGQRAVIRTRDGLKITVAADDVDAMTKCMIAASDMARGLWR